jgi:hypothetical protein
MVKILHLVLYSRNIHYDMMKTITEQYYKKFNNVDTYYYLFDNELDGIYNNIVYIKGNDTFVPGILTKTIKAFEKFNEFENYDYVIRSNISTLVNFTLLSNYLKNNIVMYGGGLIFDLQWCDYSCGITDKTYWGTHFVSGTCIILNRETACNILKNLHLLNYNIIDDVAIGVLLKNLNINITNIGQFIYCNKHFCNISNNIIFYRNKNIDRNDDIINLRFLTENL